MLDARLAKQLRPLESHEQTLYFKWLDYVTIDKLPLRPHCYAVPNGGARQAVEAARLKAQGVTPGVADISIDVPAGPYHGLRIEMKRRGERATDEQMKHVELRRSMGYHATVCEGFEEARTVTIAYLRARWVVVDRWLT